MNAMDQVIRGARAEFEPSAADRERVKRRLLARAAGMGLVVSLAAQGSAGAAPLASALAGQSLGLLSKWFFGSMLATFAVGGVVVGATRGFSTAATVPGARDHAAVVLPRAKSAGALRASPEAPLSPVASEPPGGAASSSATSSAASVGAFVAPAPRVDPTLPGSAELEAELGLLREARLASTRGEVAHAQKVLDALDLWHPRGQLLEERAALRAITNCEAASSVTSRAASDFLKRYPASVYAAKVRHACRIGAEAAPQPSPGATATFTDPVPVGH